MPIRMDYAPIGAGLRLAQQAGAGAGQWQRIQLMQDILGRQDRQTALLLQRRSQETGEAMAHERMRRQEQQYQTTLAQRQTEFGAAEQYRQMQMGLQQQAAGLAQRREARITETGAQATARQAQQWQAQQQLREAAGTREQERIALSTESLGLQRERFEATKQAYVGSPQAKALEKQISNLRQQLSRAERDVERYRDPIAKSMGELRPASDQEDRFNEALARMGQINERLQAVDNAYNQGLNAAIAGMPQVGRQAAANLARAGAMGRMGQMPQEANVQELQNDVARFAQALNAMIPRTFGPEQVRQQVEMKMKVFPNLPRDMVEMVAEAVIEMRQGQ